MRLLRRLLGCALLLVGGLLTALWWSRSNLPYNEQGRYFDSATATVYQEQSLLVYAGLALACFVTGAQLIVLGRKV